MLSLLVACGASACTHAIRVELGVRNYEFDLGAGDTVCLNVTAYPFSILFGDFGDNTLYREYTRRPIEGSSVRSFEALLRFLPMHRTLIEPEHSITLTAIDPTRLSFTTAELPGMCREGIFLSTMATNAVEFGPEFPVTFFRINEFDDKCIVIGPYSLATVNVDLQSDGEDQVFIYHDFTEYDVITGTDNYDGNFSEGAFLRVVTYNESSGSNIRINVTCDSNARNPRTAQFIPTRPPQACDPPHVWYNERIAVTMVAVTSCVGAVFLLMLCAVSIRQSMAQASAKPTTQESYNRSLLGWE